MKKVPGKFKGCGIRIQCLKCRSEITETCKGSGKSISACRFKDKHKFKLVVHKPKTQSGKITRLLDCERFDDALVELGKFRDKLKENALPAAANKSEAELVETVPA